MSLQEIQELLISSGIPFTHHHWEGPHGVPYGVFLTPGINYFSADNGPYAAAQQVQAELYSEAKDPEIEEKIRDVLRGAGIFWEESDDYISDIQLYRTMFEFEV